MALALLRLRSCDYALAIEYVLSRSCVGFLRIALAPLHLFAFESSDLFARNASCMLDTALHFRVIILTPPLQDVLCI